MAFLSLFFWRNRRWLDAASLSASHKATAATELGKTLLLLFFLLSFLLGPKKTFSSPLLAEAAAAEA